MTAVASGFKRFKGIPQSGLQFIKESSPEGIAKKGVVEMTDMPPKTIITVPPSETRQWICGFHFKSLPKVCRTMIKPGVKFFEWLRLKNMRKITLLVAEKRQSSKERSIRRKSLRSSSIVNTQCRLRITVSRRYQASRLRSSRGYFPSHRQTGAVRQRDPDNASGRPRGCHWPRGCGRNRDSG